VHAAIGCLFLNGVTTHKLKGIAKELWGREVNAQTVSNVFRSVDKELERFKDKPIEDTVEYLFLDGITQKVRQIGIEKKVMLCAFAFHCKRPGRDDRLKEMLSFQLTDAKDGASWKGFIADLKGQCLLHKKLKLITTDGNPALLKALKQIYPFVKG
jgi:putative transposase